MNIRPPDVASSWDGCNFWAQARIIAYTDIREMEEQQIRNSMIPKARK